MNLISEVLQTPFIQKNWEESGFDALTPVQERVLPLILDGKDIVCESPTGTGKTLAYLLPIIQGIDPNRKQAQAVILAPSRELVMQIHQEIQKWTKGSDVTSAAFIGGANIKKQVEKLKKKPHIVVGTTGRLIELMKLKKMKMHEVKTIVVDEFDLMVGSEHIREVKEIIKSTLKERQVLFFSATLSDRTEEVAEDLLQYHEIVKMDANLDNPQVDHNYVYTELRDKIEALRSLSYFKDIKALVFFNQLEKLSEAEEKLKYKGVELEVLAGESKKTERKQSLDRFRAGKVPMLLTTDVAARGLDITDVSHVIHFDFPTDTKQYIHRSGRTGRMGAEGTVISLVSKREQSFLEKLSKELNLPFQEKTIHGGGLKDPR
ncbi:DEAD/DEAH box helicase [Bacillus haikouensis]|jgi:superfamily II DNA/RNA helicase|uniref:DEAD/DEAH box helicase n=1 Tax=Bacillus haikouensis TaxID=1510468 RepID=UPI0015548AD2|nr:DEAD/DEAH box helicase [Bacillus haikouensis]NQD66552.1 DEAD/DEAH box helicase [Bacillus haikouensis]